MIRTFPDYFIARQMAIEEFKLQSINVSGAVIYKREDVYDDDKGIWFTYCIFAPTFESNLNKLYHTKFPKEN
jgi:hypothetical protein